MSFRSSLRTTFLAAAALAAGACTTAAMRPGPPPGPPSPPAPLVGQVHIKEYYNDDRYSFDGKHHLDRRMSSIASDGSFPLLIILQMNDLYEIEHVRGGKTGGPARVATLKKQLAELYPDTPILTVLAGDFVAPSALGTAVVDGAPLHGRQMIAVLNTMGLDLATFGNHEFDIPQKDLAARMAESKFAWFSSNVRDAATGSPYNGVPENEVRSYLEPDGSTFRVGFFGLTLDSNKKAWVKYLDPVEAAREQVNTLKGKADFVIGLTHLALSQDQQVVSSVGGIDLVLGGHEHAHNYVLLQNGTRKVPIAKADENVESVFVHVLRKDPKSGLVKVDSSLKIVDDTIADDPETAQVVKLWANKGFDGFRRDGFDPERPVAQITEALEGRDEFVRNGPTNLTQLVETSMMDAYPLAELAMLNAGTIRIDDQLPPGTITEYDILRTMPFHDTLCEVELDGGMLQKVKTAADQNRGSGDLLLWDWPRGEVPFNPERTYRVVTSAFVLSGALKGVAFLNRDQIPERDVRCGPDSRATLIHYLRSRLLPVQ